MKIDLMDPLDRMNSKNYEYADKLQATDWCMEEQYIKEKLNDSLEIVISSQSASSVVLQGFEFAY